MMPPLSTIPLALLPAVLILPLAVADVFIRNNERLDRQLYAISFFLAFFLSSIKLYYGTDIFMYAYLYDNVGSPLTILISGNSFNFEPAYVMFTSICKQLGFNFWTYTFIINAIYFYAIHSIFKRITKHKVFALFILCVLDVNLIFFELRECLAVAFFLFSFIKYEKKQYVLCLLFCLLSIFTHKSAAFCIFICAIAAMLTSPQLNKQSLSVVVIILTLSIVFSLSSVAIFTLDILPFGQSVQDSITHHLSYPRRFQTIYFVYILWGLFLYTHYSDSTSNPFVQNVILLFTILIACFYQHWFFLVRFRSYFLPIMLIYAFSVEGKQNQNKVLTTILLTLAIFINSIIFIRGFWMSNYYSESHINDTTTIFDLRHHPEEEIKDKNYKKTSYFFKYEYQINQLDK